MLRKLKKKDSKYMLEWMHDITVVGRMKANFLSKNIEDCLFFINKSKTCKDIHYAIVEKNDEYLGTISLKNINSNSAEFAIAIRRKAMGRNVSKEAMKEILNIGFNNLNLNYIYWYVRKDNERAVKFYDKNGYETIDIIKLNKILNTELEDDDYLWYLVKGKE